MADLFDTEPGQPSQASSGHQPLADRLRPRSLAEVIGQDQILGPDAPLGSMLAVGKLSSLIFWGPPGVGKTTIARLLADETERLLVQFADGDLQDFFRQFATKLPHPSRCCR